MPTKGQPIGFDCNKWDFCLRNRNLLSFSKTSRQSSAAALGKHQKGGQVSSSVEMSILGAYFGTIAESSGERAQTDSKLRLELKSGFHFIRTQLI
jgi:hypothetical protein